MMATKRIAALIVLLSTHSVAAKCRDGSNAADDLTTTYKDVVIVGGGASGVYSAVRLREDYGLSVVVVEKDIQLVGDPRFAPRTLSFISLFG